MQAGTLRNDSRWTVVHHLIMRLLGAPHEGEKFFAKPQLVPTNTPNLYI